MLSALWTSYLRSTRSFRRRCLTEDGWDEGMDLNLNGRVAIVTGGSQGIGYATAEELMKEGGAVSICARAEARLERARAELEQKTGGRCEAIRADVMDQEQIQAFVEETR